MDNTDFFVVWRTIIGLQGEEFHTKSGLTFTYSIKGDILIPSRTMYNISRKEFQKACGMMPIKGPGEIKDEVRGPAYVYAILTDRRVVKKPIT